MELPEFCQCLRLLFPVSCCSLGLCQSVPCNFVLWSQPCRVLQRVHRILRLLAIEVDAAQAHKRFFKVCLLYTSLISSCLLGVVWQTETTDMAASNDAVNSTDLADMAITSYQWESP